MLILTAKPGETVHLETPDGQELSVTYLGASGENGGPQVRIGFIADRDVTILRDKVKRRNEGGNR